MKKIYLTFLILLTLCLSGCSEKITMENIDKVETEYHYSNVVLGRYLKEIKENKVITEAKDFARKFISIQQNKSYDEKTSLENEMIMYSEKYKEEHKEELENSISYGKEFYNKYQIKTEVQSVDFEKIIILKGDAYVNAIAKVRLTHCETPEIAGILGYKDGINSNIQCEYKIKMVYDSGEYFVYDYELVEKEGYLNNLASYEVLIKEMNSAKEIEEVSTLIKNVLYTQNNRDYKTFKGNEDYQYLSSSLKAELNKDVDDVAQTKNLYNEYKLNTQYINHNIVSIVKTEEGFTVLTDVKVKIAECKSEELAKRLGFTGGIGSERIMRYSYTIAQENGVYKVFKSKMIY